MLVAIAFIVSRYVYRSENMSPKCRTRQLKQPLAPFGLAIYRMMVLLILNVNSVMLISTVQNSLRNTRRRYSMLLIDFYVCI